MALRDDLLPAVEDIRGIPQDLGIRTTRVLIRTRTWDGGEVQLGQATDVDVEILPRPKVKEEGQGFVEVGPITPSHTTGGWSPATLLPDEAVATETLFVLIGPSGEEETFRLSSVNPRKAFRYTLTLETLNRIRPTFD